MIAHVGWSVDPGVLIMRNTDFHPLGVPDQIRDTHGDYISSTTPISISYSAGLQRNELAHWSRVLSPSLAVMPHRFCFLLTS